MTIISNITEEYATITRKTHTLFIPKNQPKVIKNIGINRYDKEKIALLKYFAKEGDNYLEIGANYGFILFDIADKIGENGTAYGIEASPILFKALSLSAKVNNYSNVIVNNFLLFSEYSDSELPFFQGKSFLSGHFINKTDVDLFNNSQIAWVKTLTLDQYFADKSKTIDVFNLDAEGAECEILAGAPNLLKNSLNLKIMVDWQPDYLERNNADKNICLSSLNNLGLSFWKYSLQREHAECTFIFREVLMDFLVTQRGKKGTEFLAIKKDQLYNEVSNKCIESTNIEDKITNLEIQSFSTTEKEIKFSPIHNEMTGPNFYYYMPVISVITSIVLCGLYHKKALLFMGARAAAQELEYVSINKEIITETDAWEVDYMQTRDNTEESFTEFN